MSESHKAISIPLPPIPMTPLVTIDYLANIITRYPVEDRPIMLAGRPIVNALVSDDRVIFQRYLDMLNQNPPCREHFPTQHRDGKQPWCNECGLTAAWEVPKRYFGPRTEST